MTVRRYRQAPDGRLIPIEEWVDQTKTRPYHIVPDIKPYVAVTGDMQGKTITSRKEHREFLRRNNLEEVGNEKGYMTRNGGMTDDNPNLISDSKYEERVCQSLMRNLERLRGK